MREIDDSRMDSAQPRGLVEQSRSSPSSTFKQILRDLERRDQMPTAAEIVAELGPLQLSLAELNQWCVDFGERHSSFVELLPHIGPNGQMFYSFKIGSGSTVIELLAGNHGEEKRAVDVNRAMAVLIVTAPEILDENDVSVLITPLTDTETYSAAGPDGSAGSITRYSLGHLRLVAGDQENDFNVADPPFGVQVQKSLMEKYRPSTRISLHGNAGQDIHVYASRNHLSTALVLRSVASKFSLLRSGAYDDGFEVEYIAGGIFTEPRMRPGSAVGMNSNSYYAMRSAEAAASLRNTIEIPENRVQSEKWVSSVGTFAARLHAALRHGAFWLNEFRHFEGEEVSQNPADAAVWNAAMNRRLHAPRAAGIFGIDSEQEVRTSIFRVRDAVLIGRALCLVEEHRHLARALDLAAEMDSWDIVEPIEPERAVAAGVELTARLLTVGHGFRLLVP